MKKVFLYVSIGLLLLAIPATIVILGKQRDVRTRAAPATTLSLTPAVKTVKEGDTSIKLNVDVDPGANQVVSADIYVTYDPTKLEATAITNGASAPRILTSGIIENGTASIKVGAASNAQPITTPGTMAVITFTAKETTGSFGPTAVQFASNTFVGGLNEPTANVLVGTNPAKITITDTSTTDSDFASESGTLATAAKPTITLTPVKKATSSATLTTKVAGLTPTPTITLTPTITPATGSAEATSSGSTLQILSPTQNADVATAQPVIRGTAAPGSIVTIVIHSDSGITATVTADENGNWVYTPTSALDPGLHSIVASAQSDTGTTQTSTSSFVVASGAEVAASESAVPISGNAGITVLLLGLGVVLMISGAFVWHF